jgi:hypothetical protein
VFDFLLWNQDLLFFTRQIGIDPVSGQEVPIDVGGKIAGHAGGFDLGVMDVRTREDGPNPSANYAVARIKRPLTPGSYIGAIMTDKENGNPLDPYDRAIGFDGKFVLFGNLNLRGYYAKTMTTGLSGDNAAFGGVSPTQTIGSTCMPVTELRKRTSTRRSGSSLAPTINPRSFSST